MFAATGGVNSLNGPEVIEQESGKEEFDFMAPNNV